MKTLKGLFQVKGTYIGIAAAILFQVIFFSVWLTAYHDVEKRAGNLSIGLVNEDANKDMQFAEQLKQAVPFRIKEYSDLEQAAGELNERAVHMIIQIPADFSTSLQAGKTPSIDYWINQATASATKTMMLQTAQEVSRELNQQFFSIQKTAMSSGITQAIAQMPLDPPIAHLIGNETVSAIGSLDSEPAETVVHKTNNVEEFSANLVPLMVIISSFVGAMVMIMQINEAATSIRSLHPKWSLFWSRQIINLAVAFLLPLLTISLMKLFGINSQESFAMIYLFQSVLFLAFLTFAQVFVFLFGNLGMVFNILALSLQLVTSGVLVSRELLSNSYQEAAAFLPATYGADGYFAIIFGGGSGILTESIRPLLIITVLAFGLAAGVTALKRDGEKAVITEKIIESL
ncbi:YhgE/Pip domain-containing protein [Sporosarcina cascadiensis]|uniref:YhgE/Pip domain-containing protein n=1 Tax=Sporosarcina cascadiensis TaxID=2660747 RepID=UPI00129C107C|nr:ABC transporter permease [Sporosarcina cascadiensis]